MLFRSRSHQPLGYLGDRRREGGSPWNSSDLDQVLTPTEERISRRCETELKVRSEKDARYEIPRSTVSRSPSLTKGEGLHRHAWGRRLGVPVMRAKLQLSLLSRRSQPGDGARCPPSPYGARSAAAAATVVALLQMLLRSPLLQIGRASCRERV